jgi:hypothetical protein
LTGQCLLLPERRPSQRRSWTRCNDPLLGPVAIERATGAPRNGFPGNGYPNLAAEDVLSRVPYHHREPVDLRGFFVFKKRILSYRKGIFLRIVEEKKALCALTFPEDFSILPWLGEQ